MCIHREMQSTDSNEKAREQDVDSTAHEYMPQHVAEWS
jgi:hypothetical protein